MLTKLSKIYPPLLEFLPLFLFFFIIYLVLTNYSLLPERIPTHFDFQGVPDGWGSKNTIFMYLGFGGFIFLLITGVSLALAVTGNPKSLINLPESVKEKITTARAEILRVFLVRALWVLKVIVLGLNVFLLYGNLEIAFSRWDNLGYWPFLFLVAILITIGFLIFRSFRLALSDQ